MDKLVFDRPFFYFLSQLAASRCISKGIFFIISTLLGQKGVSGNTYSKHYTFWTLVTSKTIVKSPAFVAGAKRSPINNRATITILPWILPDKFYSIFCFFFLRLQFVARACLHGTSMLGNDETLRNFVHSLKTFEWRKPALRVNWNNKTNNNSLTWVNNNTNKIKSHLQ